MLPQQHRLKSRGHFRAVQTRGRKFVGRAIIVRALATADPRPSRFGFSVSEKVGNAVVRNLVKRRLREIIRQMLPLYPVGTDVVITARHAAPETTYEQLGSDVRQALEYLCRSGRKPGKRHQASGA